MTRETEAIKRAVLAYPGVIDVISLVDAPYNPATYRWECILAIGIERSMEGWRTLECLAWGLNGRWKKGVGDFFLYPHSANPAINKDSLSFILSGKWKDPADAINIALFLSDMRD